jgi:hypothetical protein
MMGWLRWRLSDRKLRLFACACCRHIWSLIADPRSQEAVRIAEEYADGRVPSPNLLAARQAAAQAVEATSPWTKPRAAAQAAEAVARLDWSAGVVATPASAYASWEAHTAPRGKAGRAGRKARLATESVQAALLRDIVGIPFRSMSIEAACLTRHGGAIPKLAQAIYDDRRFSALPVLADALEEAGCTDPDILGHCRGPGPHVRGCWVVDLLLGKQ